MWPKSRSRNFSSEPCVMMAIARVQVKLSTSDTT